MILGDSCIKLNRKLSNFGGHLVPLESKFRGHLKQKRAKSPFFEGQGKPCGLSEPFTLIKCLGNTSWPLRSSKEIPLFIEDVTERTCRHYSLGCLEIRSRIFRLSV